MLVLTLTLTLCLAATTAAGSFGSQSTAQKCVNLEKALNIYLPNRMHPDMLYGILGIYLDLDNGLLQRIVKSSRLDFMNSRSERHQFACKIAATRSRQDVANVLGVPKWRLDNWLAQWKAAVLDVGSLKNLDDVAKVTTLLLIWAENSHYPVMPFRINDQTTLKTFGAIKNVMMTKHVHDSLINSPFPLKVSPNRALQKLKSAKSYSEFERGVFMEPGLLAEFADTVRKDPTYLRKGKVSLMGMMQLLKALNDVGVFSFPK